MFSWRKNMMNYKRTTKPHWIIILNRHIRGFYSFLIKYKYTIYMLKRKWVWDPPQISWLCRVPWPWDSANREFALPSATTSQHSPKPLSQSLVRHLFFLPRANSALGKNFYRMPKKYTRQIALCQYIGYRVIFAEGGTRQTLYRVFLGLCEARIPRSYLIKCWAGLYSEEV